MVSKPEKKMAAVYALNQNARTLLARLHDARLDVGGKDFIFFYSEDLPFDYEAYKAAALRLKPNPSAFQVAETRVGDLPMPAGSPWRCRFDHAAVLEKYGSVTRDVTCSSDGWRTQVQFTGGYCTRPDCQMREGDVDFELRRDGAGPHSPGTPGAVGVTFGPRRKLDDAKYPELP
jgi:hypothetical protein